MDYEEKLGLIQRYRELGEQAQRCMQALDRVQVRGEEQQYINEAREALQNILYER